jgi:hypothetical protein
MAVLAMSLPATALVTTAVLTAHRSSRTQPSRCCTGK